MRVPESSVRVVTPDIRIPDGWLSRRVRTVAEQRFSMHQKKILQKRRTNSGVSSNRSSPTHRVFTADTPADADLRTVFAQVPVYRTKPFLSPGIPPPSGQHSAIPVVRPFVAFPGHSDPCTIPSPFRDGHLGAVRPAVACFIALSFGRRRLTLRSTHSLVTKLFNFYFLFNFFIPPDPISQKSFLKFRPSSKALAWYSR